MIKKNNIENVTKEQFALMLVESAEAGEEIKDKRKFKIIAERIASIFEEYKEKAVEFLSDTEELEKLLLRVDEKFKSIPKVGDKLKYIPEMLLIVRSYAIKEYQEISLAEIIAIIAALIYFVSPIDVIPDSIPFAGILDDALVAGIVVSWCDEDIDKYMEWLKNKE